MGSPGAVAVGKRNRWLENVETFVENLKATDESPGWLHIIETHSDKTNGCLVYSANERGAYSADLASKVRRPSDPVSHPPTVAKMIRHAHGEAWMRRAKAFRGIKMLLLMSCGGIFEHPDSVEDMKGMITG